MDEYSENLSEELENISLPNRRKITKSEDSTKDLKVIKQINICMIKPPEGEGEKKHLSY